MIFDTELFTLFLLEVWFGEMKVLYLITKIAIATQH